MKQLTTNLYVEDQYSVPPKYRGSNPSFIVTAEGIVMIDTPYFPSDVVKWQKEILKRGEVRYIINTHHHIDHVTGNFFFGGIVVSHAGIRELMNAPITTVMGTIGKRVQKAIKSGEGMVGYVRQILEEKDPEGLSLPKDYEFRSPTITFTEKLSLYVGHHTFELMHLPGHTQTHIGVYVPQEKAFFAGDNFTYLTQPSFANSFPMDWVASLEKIEAMDIDVVVPGHGEVCRREHVREFRLFIEHCMSMVKDAIESGMSKEEAARRISFAELHPGAQNGSLPVHLGPVVQRYNVMRVYEMLSKVR